MEKKRDSNIEVMRLFAMMMITFNHIYSMTDINITDIFPKTNSLLLLIFFLGGKVGTLMYVLAGGYFLMTDKKFKLNGIIRIWLSTFIYSVCLNFVDIFFFSKEITLTKWFKSFFPVIGRYYWFSSAYIITLLLIPALRIIVKHRKITHIIAIIWTVLLLVSTVTLSGNLFSNKIFKLFFTVLGKGAVPFLYIIFMLMYFKMYYPKFVAFFQTGQSMIAGLLAYFAMYALEFALLNYGLKYNNTVMIEYFPTIRDPNSVFCIASAFSFFAFFKRLRIKYNSIINKLAALVFGVYLLQCHSRIIWEEFYHFGDASKTYEPYLFFLYGTAAVVTFFVLGFAIEQLRKLCFQKLEGKIINATLTLKCEQKIDAFYAAFDRMADKLFGVADYSLHSDLK